MGQAAISKLSRQDYLRLEELAETKHEYWDGELMAMAGSSPNHAYITGFTAIAIGSRLRGKGCRVASSDGMIFVESLNSYFYPDLSISCGPYDEANAKYGPMYNPKMVIEVLSPSTIRRDVGYKLMAYKAMPGLQHILIIYQDMLMASLYTRHDSGWDNVMYVSKEQVLRFTALDIEVMLGELYGDLINEPPFNEEVDVTGLKI